MAAGGPLFNVFKGTAMASRRDEEILRRDETAGAERRRRTLAAFILGAAISIAGLATLASYPSLAHGPFTAASPTIVIVRGSAIDEPRAADGESRRERIAVIAGRGDSASVRSYAGRQPVCVRLCDGYFFPLSAAAGDVGAQNAACASLCPDAPTEVYYRNGADSIEGAVSARGRLYTALPVSLRYRGASDNTCTCHRDAVAYAPLRDSTLRQGDAVMTPAGFMVFRGREAASHGPGEFTALAGAGLSTQARGALQAMERASLPPTHPTLRDWLVAQTGREPQVAARGAARPERNENKIRMLVLGDVQD
jgi:hypothetical protein